MRFDILTLFPGMFTGPLTESILKRAQQAGLVDIHLHPIRDYATDRHRTTDDTPYGGGAGMVMKAEPLAAALRAVLALGAPVVLPSPDPPDPHIRSSLVLLMSPDGELFTQTVAEELSRWQRLVLVCGRYEGVDERVRTTLIDREVSIGEYVITGGELAAMVVVDAVARLVPGVLDAASTEEESYGGGVLEYPHYTRPAEWEGQPVPPVLVSGHHAEVAKWRRLQSLRRTLQRRPDLFVRAAAQGFVTLDDIKLLVSL
jgi:tRNA (guanine37-N1)-methyltransferase